MADGNFELLDIKVDRIERQVNRLATKIDGDPHVVNGGGTGLIGRVDRLRSDFVLLETETHDAIDAIQSQMKRPPGWTTLVVFGGVTSLLLHLITLLAMVSFYLSLRGG